MLSCWSSATRTRYCAATLARSGTSQPTGYGSPLWHGSYRVGAGPRSSPLRPRHSWPGTANSLRKRHPGHRRADDQDLRRPHPGQAGPPRPRPGRRARLRNRSRRAGRIRPGAHKPRHRAPSVTRDYQTARRSAHGPASTRQGNSETRTESHPGQHATANEPNLAGAHIGGYRVIRGGLAVTVCDQPNPGQVPAPAGQKPSRRA